MSRSSAFALSFSLAWLAVCWAGGTDGVLVNPEELSAGEEETTAEEEPVE